MTDTTLAQATIRHRTTASPLSQLTAFALVGIALILVYLLVAIFGFAPPPAVMAALCVVFAASIVGGWRWTPLLGIVPGLAIPAMLGPMLISDSGSPAFVPGLVLIACGALAVVGGAAATVQNYRRPADQRAMPHWTPIYAAVVVGAVVGATLIGMQPKPAPSDGVSPEVLQTLPALTGKNFEFDQTEIRVKAGETVALRLENTDPEAHFLDINELNVHAPMPVGQIGVAIFKPTTPGTYTFYCQPHYDQASGQGMHGTLIVEE